MKGIGLVFLLFMLLLLVTVVDGCGRRRRSRRRPPVNRSPSISCPSVGVVTAPRLSTSARISWGTPSVSDDHGGWSVRQLSGKSSGSYFSEGSHSVTYKVTDRGGLTNACTFSFRVKVVRCSSHYRPQNGWIECDRSNNVYGRTCKFSCSDGYWLDGSSSSTCQSNGRNSYSTPSCKKKTCGEREMPPNSVSVDCTDGRYYGSMCSLRCDTVRGYTPRHLNFAQCLANTKWQYQNWGCDDTEKPKILNCPEGELKTSNSTYVWPTVLASDNSGSVTLTQKRGQRPGSTLIEGFQVIEYQAVDPSGNKAPPCVFSVTFEVPTCAAPVHGGDDYDPHFTCRDYRLGSSCQANCTFSKVIGAKYIRCEMSDAVIPDSHWVGYEGSYPTCYKKTCPDLKSPINGALACDKFLGGETCQILCNRNYDLPRSMTHLTNLICSQDGWLPVSETPDCTEMSIPDVYNLPSQLYYFGGNCSDTETSHFIRDRFLENLIRSAVDECKSEKCTIDNVKVTCGPVEEDDEEGDYYYYDDDFDESIDDDFEDFEDGDYGDGDFEITGAPEFLQRKRRAIAESPHPALTWTTAPVSFKDELEGSGEVRRRRKKKKPASRTFFTFDLAIRNTTSIITSERVVNIYQKVLNSTRTALNGTREAKFRTGPQGNLTFTCGPGKVLSNTSDSLCVACPRGMFHERKTDTCKPCPVGTYTDTIGQTSCQACGGYLYTEGEGSTSCIAMCPLGHFSATGLVPCEPCPLGTIAPEVMNTGCIECSSDSTTLQMGSSDWDQCVPFDVMVKGPVHLNLGPVITDWVEELIMSFWIRTLPPKDGHANISFILNHPTRGHQMTLVLTHQTDIKMRDRQVPVNTFIPQDLWTHVALVWKGYPSFVDLYRGGKRVEHYGGHTPLCYLPEGTELTIDIGEASSATLRELRIIPRHYQKTTELISDLAATCTPYAGQLEQSLLRKIVSTDPSKISMVIPSACSEIDRCTPNPCPDHYCRSFKYGYECVCKGGYSGRDCSVPPDHCLIANKCRNNASCTNLGDGVNCTCTEDYKGQYCEKAIIHGNWGPWSSWSECTLTCGGGARVRRRECNNPAPEPGLGKPCEGHSSEESKCNINPCPECRKSQLKLGRGISAKCSGRGGSMNCSVTCDPGLVFPEEQPSYTCTEEVWVPGDKTLACVEFSVPDHVGFKFTIPYKTRITNENEDTLVIKDKVSGCANNTSCVSDGTCSYSVTVETCVREEGGCSDFPEGYKATISFSADVVTSNWSAEVTKANLKAAWESLNVTFEDLEEMYDDCFVVIISSGTVRPGTAIADDDLTCPQGLVPDQGYCSACSPGTRLTNDTCVECERGWYQEASGQLTCDMCPAAFSTSYIGSSFMSECLAPPADSFMLLTDPVTSQVWSVNMSTFTLELVNIPANVSISSSGYDPITKHIFFADRGRPAIHSIGPRSSKTYVKLNWAATVDGITIDPISRLVFYTDKGNDVIGVVTMVTKHHKIIVRSGAYMPRDIAVDPNNGVLYWVDWGTGQKIERANYDGTDRRTLVGSNSIWPEGLALDLGANKLYWSDGGMKTVEVMDVDGKNRKTLVTSDTNFPSSITVFQDYIFYSEITSNNSFPRMDSIIMRMNKDGTGLGRTELPPFRYVSDLHSHRTSDFKSARNGCSVQNGGCAFICFPRPDGNRKCACPDGYVMSENEVDCTKTGIKARWWDVWMQPRLNKLWTKLS